MTHSVQLNFLEFVYHLFSLSGKYGAPERRRLRHMGSYFWLKINKDYKKEWKCNAKSHNRANCKTGKHRVRPFWMFSLSLKTALMEKDELFFRQLFYNMNKEDKMIFSSTYCTLEAYSELFNVLKH